LDWFSDKAVVLDLLAKSDQLQFIRCRMMAGRATLLEKMARIPDLRGVDLLDWTADWSALAKVSTLRSITVREGAYGLLDCSPFMKALSAQYSGGPWLQEWQRSDAEHKFHLTKIQRIPFNNRDDESQDQEYEYLPDEPYLESVDVAASRALLQVLPRCCSLRSLRLSLLLSMSAEGISNALHQAPSIRSLSLMSNDIDGASSLPLSMLQSFRICGSSFSDVTEALTRSKPKSLASLELELSGDCTSISSALLECPNLTQLVLSENTVFGRWREDIPPVLENLPQLPSLSSLAIERHEYSDESIECLLSFLPQSAVQDLTLGTLSPKQLQLVADVLPSLSSLLSLELNTEGFSRCQHESSHLPCFRLSQCLLFATSLFDSVLFVVLCLNRVWTRFRTLGSPTCGGKVLFMPLVLTQQRTMKPLRRSRFRLNAYGRRDSPRSRRNSALFITDDSTPR
jgi:hypothetical protein